MKMNSEPMIHPTLSDSDKIYDTLKAEIHDPIIYRASGVVRRVSAVVCRVKFFDKLHGPICSSSDIRFYANHYANEDGVVFRRPRSLMFVNNIIIVDLMK